MVERLPDEPENDGPNSDGLRDAVGSWLEEFFEPGTPVYEVALDGYEDAVRVWLSERPVTAEEPMTNYDGPDETVKCGYPPCTNRLRRSDLADEQFCCRTHRTAARAVSPKEPTDE